MYYVYLLKKNRVSDRNLYIGSTADLKKRVEEHNRASKGYTSGNKWKLIYYEAYLSKEDALKRERSIKNSGKSRMMLKARVKRSLNVP